MRHTYFWGTDSPFSQWHPATFVVGDITFTCAEQAMMHGKAKLFGDRAIARKILATALPRQHKELGRKVQSFDEHTWEKHREGIVMAANLAKFGQNADLREQLLATAGTKLVEASPHDRIWGIGLDADDPRAANPAQWRGQNLLGKILTSVREQLLKKK
jgi:ribA/ribD-fused uncharacterized protein